MFDNIERVSINRKARVELWLSEKMYKQWMFLANQELDMNNLSGSVKCLKRANEMIKIQTGLRFIINRTDA